MFRKPDQRTWLMAPMYRTEISTVGQLFTWLSAGIAGVLVFIGLKRLNQKWMKGVHTNPKRVVRILYWCLLVIPHLLPALLFFFTFSFRNVSAWYQTLKNLLHQGGLRECALSNSYLNRAPFCEYTRLSETTEMAVTLIIGTIAISYVLFVIVQIKKRREHFWLLYIPNLMLSATVATIAYFLVFQILSTRVPTTPNIPSLPVPQ